MHRSVTVVYYTKVGFYLEMILQCVIPVLFGYHAGTIKALFAFARQPMWWVIIICGLDKNGRVQRKSAKPALYN